MYLYFDIGGATTRIGLSKGGETVEQTISFSTPFSPRDIVPLWRKNVEPILKHQPVDAVIGGVAGLLSKDKTVLLRSPSLPEWDGTPLSTILSDLFTAPVYLENDAALVGLGEAVFGAGVGEKIVAFLSVSTGLGGVRIVDQYVDISASGFEPGQQLLLIQDDKIVSLEQLVAGKGIETRTGKKPETIQDTHFWDEVMKYLTVGIYNTIVHWSPHVVVLGGSIVRYRVDIARVVAYMKEMNMLLPELPLIVKAELNDLGGLYGALVFGKTKLRFAEASSIVFDL